MATSFLHFVIIIPPCDGMQVLIHVNTREHTYRTTLFIWSRRLLGCFYYMTISVLWACILHTNFNVTECHYMIMQGTNQTYILKIMAQTYGTFWLGVVDCGSTKRRAHFVLLKYTTLSILFRGDLSFIFEQPFKSTFHIVKHYEHVSFNKTWWPFLWTGHDHSIVTVLWGRALWVVRGQAPAHWLTDEQAERVEFECGDEWCRVLPWTVIKHNASSNVVTVALLSQAHCPVCSSFLNYISKENVQIDFFLSFRGQSVLNKMNSWIS